jgi:predicted Zn-dependent protease
MRGGTDAQGRFSRRTVRARREYALVAGLVAAGGASGAAGGHMMRARPVRMEVTRPSALWASLVVLLFGVAACNPIRGLNILSTEDEVALGHEFDEQIAREATLLENPDVVAYVQELAQRLAAVCGRRDLTYRARVVDAEDVNAFAVPGGFLYVNVGLLRAVGTESELAGVMAHEIGHVVGRHGAKHLSQQYGITILVKMATGDDPTLAEKIVGTLLAVGGQGLMLDYSRKDEAEADSLGVRNLYDAGFDPRGLATFFERLLAQESRRDSRLERLLSTHPPTRERAARTRAQIAALPPRTDLATDSARFRQIQALLPAPKRSQAE